MLSSGCCWRLASPVTDELKLIMDSVSSTIVLSWRLSLQSIGLLSRILVGEMTTGGALHFLLFSPLYAIADVFFGVDFTYLDSIVFTRFLVRRSD